MRNAKLPYRIIRPLARIALTIYFRKIYLSNAQVLPKDKPVILAANHPSAFLEPCILAVLLPRPLHFLVRGDFFAKPIFDRILRSLHMLPIFRMKDGGYQKIKNNFSTFNRCFSTLADGHVIMILAEGGTKHEKRLRSLQKGTGRLAFGTLEKYPDLDLQVIPVGVNYSNSDRFRSRAMIQFGQPMPVQKYYQEYKDDVNNGIKKLTEDLREALKKNIIIIADKKDDALTERLFTLNNNSWPEAPQPAVSRNNYHLKSEQTIASRINAMSEAEKAALYKQLDQYENHLQQNGLEDAAVALGAKAKSGNILMLIIGFLPFLLGYLTNALPLVLADKLINKKVKAIEFRASVKITVTIIFYLLYWLILLGLILYAGYFQLLFILLALPFFGYYALLYMEYANKWRTVHKLKKVEEKQYQELKQMRTSIWKAFDLPQLPKRKAN